MPKWNKLYILKLSPDEIIHSTAEVYREFHMVPKEQRFRFATKGQKVVAEAESKRSKGIEWTTAVDGCLQPVTMSDKLMIVAHGGDDQVAGMDAEQLTTWMSIWGLREVGLITFSCCDVGRKTFLEDFRRYCTSDTRMIKIGWLKAYRGTASTSWTEEQKQRGERPKEVIRNKHFNLKRYLFGSKEGNELSMTQNKQKKGAKRTKIIEGTHPFNVPDSRYFEIAGD